MRTLRRLSTAALLLALATLGLQAQTATKITPPVGRATIVTNGDTVAMDVLPYATIAVQVTGTWTGTLQTECTVDGGTYTALRMTPTDTTTVVTSVTANGLWTVPVAGCQTARVRATATVTGVAQVTMSSSIALAKYLGGLTVTDALQNGGTQATFSATRTPTESPTQTTAGVDESLSTVYSALKFTAAATEMGGVRVRLKCPGCTAGTITSYLYTDSAGSPGSNISDTSTGLPTIVYAAGLTASYAEYEFRLPQTGMTIGNAYWVALNVASVAGGTVTLDRQTAGTGQWATSADGAAWTPVNSKTAWYKILGNSGHAIEGTSTDGAGGYFTSSSGFAVRGISVTGPGGKFDSTYNFGVGGTSFYEIGVRGSSNTNHAIQGVAAAGGLAGGQFITTGAGQPAVQAASTSGPAIQLVPTTGAFAQIIPLDATGRGVISTWGWIGEEITLSGATTTSSTANLIPANSVIDSVSWRVTQTISGGTATAFQLGITGDATAWQNTISTLTAGTVGVGLNQWLTGGHAQASATAKKLLVTLDGTSAAGKIGVVVFYRAFTTPTS